MPLLQIVADSLLELVRPIVNNFLPYEVLPNLHDHVPWRSGPIGVFNNYRYHEPPITRVAISFENVSLWGWPSRGGLIVLAHATPLDLDTLGLPRIFATSERPHRDRVQASEDVFCQNLLRLGARWFDSRARWCLICALEAEGDDAAEVARVMEAGEESDPTAREMRWACVGWTGSEEMQNQDSEEEVVAEGGIWVADFERCVYGAVQDPQSQLVPDDWAKLSLARTMEERCRIIEMLGGKYYARKENYKGFAMVNAWAWKTDGEHGWLTKTEYDEPREGSQY